MEGLGCTLHGWQGWTSGGDESSFKRMPAFLRRRVTPIGRHALNAAWDLPETQNARLVLSSRHGEFERTLSLLEAVTGGDDVSPADFTLSVHHALAGLLSIHHGNRRGHVAVAAGQESFCFGFLEALACLKEDPETPVVLIHFDEPLPGPFSAFNETGDRPLVLALALGAAGEGKPVLFNSEPSSPGEGARSLSPALDFLDFLENDRPECLSTGEQRQWRWTRHALA